jgi:hypothetical protein
VTVWPACSCDQFEIATLEYVDWYNHRRLHSGAAAPPPAVFEALHQPTEPRLAGYKVGDAAAQPRTSERVRPGTNLAEMLAVPEHRRPAGRDGGLGGVVGRWAGSRAGGRW